MYMGNPLLRGAGEKVAMTEEQIEQYIKCKTDIIYFAENFFYVQSKGNRHTVKLYDYQKKVLKVMVDTPDNKQHICFLSGRQLGKSMVSSIYLTHCALFEKDDNIIILANKEATAKEVLEKIKMAYSNFPLWLQKGIVAAGWNKNSVTLENGIKILAASSSSDSVRGTTSSRVYVDEASFIPEHIWPSFWNSVYSIVSSYGDKAKIILTSTPKGLNHFYDIYSDAVKGLNNFYPIKVIWNAHPDRDEAWAERTKKDMGDIRSFMQEHCGDFQGSSNTLINAEFFTRFFVKNPIEYKYNGSMLIYEQPIEGKQYVLGCDPSRGTGADSSTIQVLKINSEKDLEQVAIYHNEFVDPETFAEICIGVSDFYNSAPMMVESNDIGSLVCDKIWNEHENENLINIAKTGLGVSANRKTKLAGNLLLKKYIENGYLEVVDNRTRKELATYCEVSPGVFHADSESDKDDAVTSLIWAVTFITTEFYDPDSNGKSLAKSKDNRKTSDEDKPIFFSSNDFSYNPEYNPGYSQQNHQNFSNDFDNFF